MELVHKNCGGKVSEDWESPPYQYDANEDGHPSEVPVYRCEKCHVEILGDAQIEEKD